MSPHAVSAAAAMTTAPGRRALQAKLIPLLAGSLLLILAANPALAHHMEGGRLPTTYLGGLLSGIAHPVIGPDHLVFLLAIGLAGSRSPGRWVPALVACGLGGSLLGLAWPALPWIEPLVALSLVAAGLVALGKLPRPLMLPLIGCHGAALAGVMVGAEPTPLLAYLLGLGLVQTTLLLAGLALFRVVKRGHRPLAGAVIGVGLISTLALALA